MEVLEKGNVKNIVIKDTDLITGKALSGLRFGESFFVLILKPYSD